MLQKLILLEFSYYVKMCVQFQTGVGSTRRGGGGWRRWRRLEDRNFLPFMPGDIQGRFGFVGIPKRSFTFADRVVLLLGTEVMGILWGKRLPHLVRLLIPG